MNKEFIPYKQAFALKELGFDEPCITSYDRDGKLRNPFDYNNSEYNDNLNCQSYFEDAKHFVQNSTINQSSGFIAAPTFSQAFRWFRVKHKLVHQITSLKYKGGVNFDYDIFSLVLPTDDELGDEDDVASDKSMETYDSLVEKDFRHNESDTYEEAELACLIKLIEIVKL